MISVFNLLYMPNAFIIGYRWYTSRTRTKFDEDECFFTCPEEVFHNGFLPLTTSQIRLTWDTN